MEIGKSHIGQTHVKLWEACLCQNRWFFGKFPKGGKGGGGISDLFGNFPKIHLFWQKQASLSLKAAFENRKKWTKMPQAFTLAFKSSAFKSLVWSPAEKSRAVNIATVAVTASLQNSHIYIQSFVQNEKMLVKCQRIFNRKTIFV